MPPELTPAPINFSAYIVEYSSLGLPTFDVDVIGTDPGGSGGARGSVTEPASSPNAVAVGATCFSATTPEPYSSRGPTLDGRDKPDVLAPDSVSGATYGASGGCEDGFAGTSAAAPHVAGAAALIEQRFASLGPAGVQAWLAADAEYAFASLGPLFLAATPRPLRGPRS